jgi:hypothetical protein
MKRRSEFLTLPKSNDGDSRDSSLVVYTITVAIAISLFIFVFSVDRKLLWSVTLSIVSATFYLIAAIKTLIAIELLVDITSFKENNNDDEERFVKYKRVLLNYNWSVLFIISSTILLFANLVFQYIVDLKLSFFLCLKNECSSLGLAIDALLICLSVIVSYPSVTKWRKDIIYVRRAKFIIE